MTQRREEFPPDGKRISAPPHQVAATWRIHTHVIPPQFAVGTADHESSFTLNEVDVEPSGYVSKGIFQVSEDEAREVGMPRADLLQLEDATTVFVALCERRLFQLRAAAAVVAASDIWAYLAIAHNAGLHTALQSIRRFGLDWAGFKVRNVKPEDPHAWGSKIARYGDDVISGGMYWKALTITT